MSRLRDVISVGLLMGSQTQWGSPSASDPRAKKYGPTCHQRDRADVTEFVTLVRLSSLGQHVRVLALAGYKRRKSALTAGPINWWTPTVRTVCSRHTSSSRIYMRICFDVPLTTVSENIKYSHTKCAPSAILIAREVS